MWTIQKILTTVLTLYASRASKCVFCRSMHFNFPPKKISLCFSVLSVLAIKPRAIFANLNFSDKIKKKKVIPVGNSCSISNSLHVHKQSVWQRMMARPNLLALAYCGTKHFHNAKLAEHSFLLGLQFYFVQAWNYLKTSHQKPCSPILGRHSIPTETMSCCIGLLEDG